MRAKSMMRWIAVLSCLLGAAVLVNSQTKQTKPKPTATGTTVAAPAEPPLKGPNTKEGASQASKSAKVLTEIMGTPDKGIPSDLLDKAECVLVFPKVVKGGFIVGGQAGRGVASCRLPSGWSAPAYFELKGGSIGLQVGGQAIDFVLLVMNESGMKNLLSNKFELGGDASITAAANKTRAPQEVQVCPDTLKQYSSRAGNQ